jgi:4-hydroxy-3-polyprenylbenzoate decarboxylase
LIKVTGIGQYKVILIVDHTVNIDDYFVVAWHVLGNSDPVRDHFYIGGSSLLFDSSIKVFRNEGFPRRWPNIVCSDNETITDIDKKWDNLGIGDFIQSPSLKSMTMKHDGEDEIKRLIL